MTQVTTAITGYKISNLCKTLIADIKEFHIPDGEDQKLQDLHDELQDLANEIEIFSETYTKLSYAEEFYFLDGVETQLTSLSVWVPFNLKNNQKMSDIGIEDEVWEAFKVKLHKFKVQVRAYMVQLTPAAIKKMTGQISTLSTTIKEINENQREQTSLIKKLELENVESIQQATNDAAIEVAELRSSTRKEFNKIKGEVLQSFTNEIASEIDTFNSQLKDSKSALTTEITDAKSSLNNQIDSLNSELEEAIRVEVKSFANQKNRLTEILGSLSEFRRAKSDIANADHQREEADRLRLYGLVAMTLPLLAFLLFFVSIENLESSYSLAINLPNDVSGYLIRFLTIVLFSSPSVYLLKESAYHRKQELLYRNRGVQLGSIGAFLEDVPSEIKTTIKQELVKTFYGPADGKVDVSNVPDMVQQIKDVALLSKSLNKIHGTNQSSNQPQSSEPTK